MNYILRYLIRTWVVVIATLVSWGIFSITADIFGFSGTGYEYILGIVHFLVGLGTGGSFIIAFIWTMREQERDYNAKR